jgi:hypothetical protein
VSLVSISANRFKIKANTDENLMYLSIQVGEECQDYERAEVILDIIEG